MPADPILDNNQDFYGVETPTDYAQNFQNITPFRRNDGRVEQPPIEFPEGKVNQDLKTEKTIQEDIIENNVETIPSIVEPAPDNSTIHIDQKKTESNKITLDNNLLILGGLALFIYLM